MRLRNNLFALLLALGLLAAGGTAACAAVEDGGFADVATVEDSGFIDVAAYAWYAEAVSYCRDNGIMSGITETEFAPQSAINRAMLATVLHRAAGSPAAAAKNPFSDVAEGQWYTDGVVWAAESGIMSGYGGGRFGAADPVTREQIATILWRQAGSPALAGGTGSGAAGPISAWAVDAVAWAQQSGLLRGIPEGLFVPGGSATRAEVAVMLQRYLAAGQAVSQAQPEPSNNDIVAAEDGMISVNITVDSAVFAARFYDNASARAILEQMPFSLNMSDYGRQEKVTGLPFNLPGAATERPDTINIGDIYLWSGNRLVLFYTTFSNSYSYVPVGYIEDTSGLTEALGGGSVTVTLSTP